MKMMYNILLEKTNGLADLVDSLAKTGEAAEIKELVARFTTDVIGKNVYAYINIFLCQLYLKSLFFSS